jgi:cytochrome c553
MRGFSTARFAALGLAAALCTVVRAQAAVDGDLSWLFPPNPAAANPPTTDGAMVMHLAGSRLEFTQAQLSDLFSAPDWHPESHSPMPEIVLHGRTPRTYACGYCHLPAGQGRPENAALAGLPAAYIVQQVADIKSGARRVWHGAAFKPSEYMREVAADVSDADLAAAAEYFSEQSLRSRALVSERSRIPRMRATAWIYITDPAGGEETLGRRLIEWAPDIRRHELRDADMRYRVFVPPGSLARGREISTTGRRLAQPCGNCHGARLQGTDSIPALAGRSPSYLLRQLVAFQSKDRAGATAAPMQAEVAHLNMTDMIAVAAYAAAK